MPLNIEVMAKAKCHIDNRFHDTRRHSWGVTSDSVITSFGVNIE